MAMQPSLEVCGMMSKRVLTPGALALNSEDAGMRMQAPLGARAKAAQLGFALQAAVQLRASLGAAISAKTVPGRTRLGLQVYCRGTASSRQTGAGS